MGGPIFVTGASGCVGHYVIEALLESEALADRPLWLLLRNPGKLRADLAAHPRVEILPGDLLHIDKYTDRLAQVETAILVATVWGGEYTFDINVNRTIDLLQALDPTVCQQVFYFGTASVLDRHNQPLAAARTFGTDYIRSKYACAQRLKSLAIAPKLTAVYPTLVIGGDATHPASDVSKGLPEVAKHIRLARRLAVDGTFHLIHARDIAQIITHLIENPEPPDPDGLPHQKVLGIPALKVNEAVDRVSTLLVGRPARFKLPLSIALADLLIKLFKIQIGPWDRFSMQYRHFTYQNVISPAELGLETFCPTIEAAFRLSGLAP